MTHSATIVPESSSVESVLRNHAIAVLEAELEAMQIGAIQAPPRALAEVRVSLETIRLCDEAHVPTTLQAIFEVRHWDFEA